MNILFCTLGYYPGVTGGAERQARLQAEALVRRGHSVTVVCASEGKLRSGKIDGVDVIRLRRMNVRFLFRISYLVRLFLWLLRRAGRYELVHVHLANLQADVAVLAAHLHRRPCYVKVACGGSVGEVQRFRRMARLTRWYGLRHADRVQVLSAEIRDELTSIGVPEERMVEIPNGVWTERFCPVSSSFKRSLRQALKLPERGVIVLFVGRLVDYKGIYDLLEGWSGVQNEDAHLVIVGATDEELSVPARVTVRGWAESPLAFFRAADVFVHPSHADGMSNAVLEAMACGCALVATDHRATDNFLTNGRDALLVPVRSPAALSGALERLASDVELRQRLSANAVATASRYGIEQMVQRIEAEYRSLLPNLEPPGPAGQTQVEKQAARSELRA